MDNMRRIGLLVLTALTSGLSVGTAGGDTLLVDSVATAAAVVRPDRGMTMDRVLARFGEPRTRSGPVGNPPIATWDYGDFVVYFERQYVIHSVIPHKK
jgi:hypothetical protein